MCFSWYCIRNRKTNVFFKCPWMGSLLISSELLWHIWGKVFQEVSLNVLNWMPAHDVVQGIVARRYSSSAKLMQMYFRAKCILFDQIRIIWMRLCLFLSPRTSTLECLWFPYFFFSNKSKLKNNYTVQTEKLAVVTYGGLLLSSMTSFEHMKPIFLEFLAF